MTDHIYTIFFSSRNKDNVDLENFKPRTRTFLSKYANYTCTELDPRIAHQFDEFVRQGVDGELSRWYISINPADPAKVNNSLIHYLIDHQNATPLQVQNKLISFANTPQNLATHRWLLDCDTSDHNRFLKILHWLENNKIPITQYKPTKSGYAIVTEHGFDTREFLKKFPEVENKKESDLLVCYAQNKEEELL